MAPSTKSRPLPTSSVYAFTAPSKRFPEIFSRCPRYFSHFPAAEIWSVVHLPFAFMSIGMQIKSLPFHFANGSRSCKRSLSGSTMTSMCEPSAGGAIKVSLPASYPLAGSTSPKGAFNFTCVPSGASMVSVVGSKSNRPASASAITVSGLVTKLSVFAEPSLRLGKLRLNELTMVFGLSVISLERSH